MALKSNHPTRYKILGIGSACVDLLFRVDDAFLLDNKILKGDSISTSWPHFSSVLEICKRDGLAPIMTTGGSAANTLKGLAKLGNATAFYGTKGNDDLGVFLEHELAKTGIHPILNILEMPTTQIAVFVTDDHQRSFLCCPGASRLAPTIPLLPTLFEHVELVHIEGYMLDELGIPYVETLMATAKEFGAAVSIDMGCPRIAHHYSAELLRLIKTYVTITFANEQEVKAILGMPPQEGCAAIAQLCPIAAIGVGKDGCWVAAKNDLFKCDGIKVEAVDTTGAGDLFASGFLHYYLKGKPLKECAAFANRLGGTVVKYIGAEIPESEWIF